VLLLLFKGPARVDHGLL